MTFSNDNPNADFSDVGGSTTPGSSPSTGGTADFSDVTAGSSSTATRGTSYIVRVTT